MGKKNNTVEAASVLVVTVALCWGPTSAFRNEKTLGGCNIDLALHDTQTGFIFRNCSRIILENSFFRLFAHFLIKKLGPC